MSFPTGTVYVSSRIESDRLHRSDPVLWMIFSESQFSFISFGIDLDVDAGTARNGNFSGPSERDEPLHETAPARESG